jgi:hypothetical protein
MFFARDAFIQWSAECPISLPTSLKTLKYWENYDGDVAA